MLIPAKLLGMSKRAQVNFLFDFFCHVSLFRPKQIFVRYALLFQIQMELKFRRDFCSQARELECQMD